MNLVLWITACDPRHIADVGVIHADQIIVFLIIMPRHLTRPVSRAGNMMLPENLHRPVMDTVADLLRAGGCGVYVETVGKSGFIHHLPEDELGHRGTADVAVADEKYLSFFCNSL